MKNKMITLQKTVYLSGQSRKEGACVQPNSNIEERCFRNIISDKKMTVNYKFDLQKWEYFPCYENNGAKTDIYDSISWGGLRKMFPFVDLDANVECLVTVIFDENDVERYISRCEIKSYERNEEKYNFHTESDFYAVTKDGGDVMICKGENTLDWEIDNGCIKWDCDRENGDSIYSDSPFEELFPESYFDCHSVGIPYKIKIIVDAAI